MRQSWAKFTEWMQQTPTRRAIALVGFMLFTIVAVPLGHTPEVKRYGRFGKLT